MSVRRSLKAPAAASARLRYLHDQSKGSRLELNSIGAFAGDSDILRSFLQAAPAVDAMIQLYTGAGIWSAAFAPLSRPQ